MKNSITSILTIAASFAALSQLSAQTDINWTGGGTADNWSDAANWGGNTPDANDEVARYLLFPTIDIEVDSNFTINSYLDGFDGAAQTTTFSGAGVLTIDRNSAGFGAGITNATGNAGGILNFSGNVTIDNTLGGTTSVLNANSTGNTTRFAAGSTLTLNTNLQTGSSGNATGSSHQFNGTLAGAANLIISSDNVSFGTGHDSSGYTGTVVINSNSKLAIDGGTVLNSNANSRFQINGNNSELELNAANAINDAGMSIASTNTFTLDVNANQENMGFLNLGAGTLNLDLAAGVTSLWFSDSSSFGWTDGTVTISGFKENTIRFGTDADGLTEAQLGQIDGGIYSLTDQGYLSIPEPGAFAMIFGLVGIGLSVSRRHR